MKSEQKINITHAEKISFRANRFIIGIQLKEGKRFRWPLHAMREWDLTPENGQGLLKEPQKLKIIVGQYELIITGNHLETIDEVFCEGSGGDIIERGTRYAEVTQAIPYVAKIEVRDSLRLADL